MALRKTYFTLHYKMWFTNESSAKFRFEAFAHQWQRPSAIRIGTLCISGFFFGVAPADVRCGATISVNIA